MFLNVYRLLWHLKLRFPVHKECVNGDVSNYGVQPLSTLSKVEVAIGGSGIR
jgi:hypothetical protein